ncbi:nitrogen fixation protein FixH [Polaromonas sp. YR568]|uniref:nitrogen fixation protein FixH n=1 Tax=Polaromonas sp. YR568 TaxID=1855301 RepID=UPI003137F612
MTTLPTPSIPWWKHGHVWLVISGPALVIVASAVTIFLTLKYPDTVIRTQPAPQVVKYSAPSRPVSHRALAPALEGRNHAATPDRSSQPQRP